MVEGGGGIGIDFGELTPEMKKIIAEVHPGIIATASKTGEPNVSAKGSFRVLDNTHVLFADIRSPRTIANLRENPRVAALVLNPETNRGVRIWGKAEIFSSGPLLDQINHELAARNMRAKHVVKIEVEEATIYE